MKKETGEKGGSLAATEDRVHGEAAYLIHTHTHTHTREITSVVWVSEFSDTRHFRFSQTNLQKVLGFFIFLKEIYAPWQGYQFFI